MKTATRLEGIGEYYFSQKLREIARLNAAGKDIINLGIGSPDLPPHPDVIRTLHEEAMKPNTHAYQGYKGVPALRNAFASWYRKWYNVALDPESEILPLIGSKEGIMHICMTYINPGDKVLVPNPGYPTYSSAVKLAGGEIVNYELDGTKGWEIDFDKLDVSAKLIFVNYPHMPTGKLPSAALFEKIVAFAGKHDILVVHDNPYSFILNDNPQSLLSVKGAKEVVIELNSLSKSHNMAGWRIGVIAAAGQRIEEILRFKSNMDSGMFLPLQLAAAKALELGEDWHKSLNAIYARRRALAEELLNKVNCEVAPQQAGMFVWAAVPLPFADGYQLSDKLLYDSDLFITPGGIFGSAGNQYVRVSLCSTEEKLTEAIKRIS